MTYGRLSPHLDKARNKHAGCQRNVRRREKTA